MILKATATPTPTAKPSDKGKAKTKAKAKLGARETMKQGLRGKSKGQQSRGTRKGEPSTSLCGTLRSQPAFVVRGSSRRINTLRFRPAYIRLINRRDGRLDCSPLGFPRAPNKNPNQILEGIDRSFHTRDVALQRLLFATKRKFNV